MSFFSKKRDATPGGEKPVKLQDFDALEKIIRHDPDVAKRRNAVAAVVEAARMFRTGLEGISIENKMVYIMARPADKRQLEATTEAGEICQRNQPRGPCPMARDGRRRRFSALPGLLRPGRSSGQPDDRS